MSRRLRPRRPSPALLIACAALFFAVGGPSAVNAAAVRVAAHIDGSDIRNNSVTGADVKTGSLLSSDVKDGALLAKDVKPGQLGAYATAETTNGLALDGTSQDVQTLNVPAGSYVVLARTRLSNTDAGDGGGAQCKIIGHDDDSTTQLATTNTNLQPAGADIASATAVLTGARTFDEPAQIDLTCIESGGATSALTGQITAIRLASLTGP